MTQIKNVSIILKPFVVEDFEVILPNLVTWLLRRKKNIFFLLKEEVRLGALLKNSFKSISFLKENEIHSKSDLIITLGGDGTLIGVSRNVKKNSPPIFGINMGNLGFTTEFSKLDFFDELELTLNGKFEIVPLPLYQVEVFKKEKLTFKSYYLNDVVVNNHEISRMLTLTVESDSEHIFNLSGDGLIISSPIGSTAYSLAAGGPIVHPSVTALTLTPICAHSLTHRPIVIPETSIINIKAQKKEDNLKLTLDGQEFFVVTSGETIVVTKAKNKIAKLVKNPARAYFRTLKEKFTHGAREVK
jgi:NAD+ kinase